jgi:hypothetical protein
MGGAAKTKKGQEGRFSRHTGGKIKTGLLDKPTDVLVSTGSQK